MVADRSMATAIGRTLPHSLEAEEHLLSCCLLDGATVITKCLLAKLSPESFYDPKHGVVFEELLELYSANKPIDVSVVAEQLKTKKKLDAVGGYAFLTQVSSRIPTTAQADYFIEKVKEAATLRLAIREMTAGVEDCYGFSGGIDEFLAGLEARMDRVSSQSAGDNEETVQDAAELLLQDLQKPRGERNGISGEVSWGIADLDRICGPLAPKTLDILAGRPSTGKSALADQTAWQAAKAQKGEVLVFSYEMSKTEKIIRIAQQESGLNLSNFDDSPMDKKLEFTRAVRSVKDNKFLHIYERDATINRLTARCRAVSRRGKVALIVVDFLQYLARLEPTLGKERTDEKIGRITAALKSLAKEHDCPVLLLSSLNREGVSEGKTPTLASLRNSGEIESDADVVMILHWPTSNPKTGQDQDPHDQIQNSFYVEANQEKGRNRGVHQVPLCFTRTATRFSCWR